MLLHNTTKPATINTTCQEGCHLLRSVTYIHIFVANFIPLHGQDTKRVRSTLFHLIPCQHITAFMICQSSNSEVLSLYKYRTNKQFCSNTNILYAIFLHRSQYINKWLVCSDRNYFLISNPWIYNLQSHGSSLNWLADKILRKKLSTKCSIRPVLWNNKMNAV